MKNLLYIPGDGYTKEIVAPFFNFLKQHQINPIYVPLLEEKETCGYDELEPENYCSYIDTFTKDFKNEKLIGYGISKGCHWLRVYASKRHGLFEKLVLVEETTMNPKNMVKFEKNRGNDFVEDYDNLNQEIEGIDSTKKALNSIVNDDNKYIPKCKMFYVWTTRNNENLPYSPDVYKMKKDFINDLKRNGANITEKIINSEHCADTKPKNFPFLLDLID